MNARISEVLHDDHKRTGISVFAGIIIWFLHQNTLYAITSIGCKWEWFGVSGLHIVDLIITVIAAVLMAIVIFWPWQLWRSFQTETPTQNDQLIHDTEKDHWSLIAFIAMSLNLFLFLFVVTSLVPILVLSACAQG